MFGCDAAGSRVWLDARTWMTGGTCAGTWVTGSRDGRPREVYLYRVVDNQWSVREYGSQAVAWQTAITPGPREQVHPGFRQTRSLPRPAVPDDRP
ncbi:saccharopine dehydrogenase-like NADP-dependent oxidoreductase [Streptomyces tendae]